MSLLATTSTVAISCYALLSAAYKSIQTAYALPIGRSPASDDPVGFDLLPSVDVIVPCFNEDSSALSACLASIAGQQYAGKLRVYVIDDGSANRDSVVPVHDAFAGDPRFNFILLPKNVGKRKAQIAAIRRSSGDLVLNVDSDTTIASNVVTKLALKMRDPAVGYVTWPALLYALPAIALTGIAFASLAMLVIALAPSHDYFVFYQTLVLTPMLLLCGAIFPTTQLPHAVQQVGHFLPLAHSIDLIRPAMLGRPAGNVGLHIGALCVYAILPFFLSGVLFRRSVDA